MLFRSVNNNTTEVLTITESGYGKRTNINEFSLASRATKGNSICKYKEEKDKVANVLLLTGKEKTIIVNSKLSSLRLNIENIPVQGRATVGLQLMKISGDNKIKNAIILKN